MQENGCVNILPLYLSESRITRRTRKTRKGFLEHYMTLIIYKEAQSNRMMLKEAQSNRMCYKEAQSNRMSIFGEGIEDLVTKTLHTQENC